MDRQMTKTVDISGMDPARSKYGYEWGCQVIMFRALKWLREHPDQNPRIEMFRNVVGVCKPANEAAKQMEDYALDHEKIREIGATGAMVHYAIAHAMDRAKNEAEYFQKYKDDPGRTYEFNEAEAFEA